MCVIGCSQTRPAIFSGYSCWDSVGTKSSQQLRGQIESFNLQKRVSYMHVHVHVYHVAYAYTQH